MKDRCSWIRDSGRNFVSSWDFGLLYKNKEKAQQQKGNLVITCFCIWWSFAPSVGLFQTPPPIFCVSVICPLPPSNSFLSAFVGCKILMGSKWHQSSVSAQPSSLSWLFFSLFSPPLLRLSNASMLYLWSLVGLIFFFFYAPHLFISFKFSFPLCLSSSLEICGILPFCYTQTLTQYTEFYKVQCVSICLSLPPYCVNLHN